LPDLRVLEVLAWRDDDVTAAATTIQSSAIGARLDELVIAVLGGVADESRDTRLIATLAAGPVAAAKLTIRSTWKNTWSYRFEADGGRYRKLVVEPHVGCGDDLRLIAANIAALPGDLLTALRFVHVHGMTNQESADAHDVLRRSAKAQTRVADIVFVDDK
jgi:hypothetical protein